MNMGKIELDNKDSELKTEECELQSFHITPKYEKDEIKRKIESEKMKYVTTGGKVGVMIKGFFKGEKDEGKDVKVSFVNELNKNFWLISGVYGCRFWRKANEIKYTVPVEKNIERIWVNENDENEVPFSKENVKLSEFMGKIGSSISISNIKFEGLESLLTNASQKMLDTLGIQDLNLTKDGKARLPNVIEQVLNINKALLCFDDENENNVEGNLKKDIVTTFKEATNKKKQTIKSKLKKEKIIQHLHKEIVREPSERPRKILEQKLTINELNSLVIPFYHLKVEGHGKIKHLFVNSITGTTFEDSLK